VNGWRIVDDRHWSAGPPRAPKLPRLRRQRLNGYATERHFELFAIFLNAGWRA